MIPSRFYEVWVCLRGFGDEILWDLSFLGTKFSVSMRDVGGVFLSMSGACGNFEAMNFGSE